MPSFSCWISFLSSVALTLAGAHPPTNTYDYVILGGGTSGLVLANRLSEDPTVTVAVIEAGNTQYNNPNVTGIVGFFAAIGTSVDWNYTVKPQRFLNGRTFPYGSGKALGGSSVLNGATYVRAQAAQIDAWEQLGNTGWNWAALWPYYLKSEHFIPPDADLVSRGATYEPLAHGTTGPLDVSFSPFLVNATGTLTQTFENLGIPHKQDQSDGDVHGFSVFPSTINSTGFYRADAARSYLLPVQSRTNLHIFNGSLAEEILWAAGSGNATATGVKVQPIGGGAPWYLNVSREVIVSGGAHKSPVILENSGIGNPEILSALNIPVKVNLPSVGENLQDQPQVGVTATAHTPFGQLIGYTPFVTYPNAEDLFGQNTSAVAAYVLSQIPSSAAMIASLSNNATPASVVETQLRIQADLIFNQSVPCAEILTLPFESQVNGILWPLLPFSRGNTHISSRDPSSNPIINPQFLIPGIDWDPISMAAGMDLIRKTFRTAPLGPMITGEQSPGTAVVPLNATVEQWLDWFKTTGAFSSLFPSTAHTHLRMNH